MYKLLRKVVRIKLNHSLTQHGQGLVQDVVEGPEVGGPVGVAEAPLEGEEPGQDLGELALESRGGKIAHRW